MLFVGVIQGDDLMYTGVSAFLFLFWMAAVLMLYHKVFTVFYFDLGKGLMKEIVGAFFLACGLTYLTAKIWWVILIISLIAAAILFFGAENPNTKSIGVVVCLVIAFVVTVVGVGTKNRENESDEKNSKPIFEHTTESNDTRSPLRNRKKLSNESEEENIDKSNTDITPEKDSIDEEKVDVEETFSLRTYDASHMPPKMSMKKNGEPLTYDDAIKGSLAPGGFVSVDVEIGSEVEISSYECYYAVGGEIQSNGESEAEFLRLGDFENNYFILIDNRLEKTQLREGEYVHVFGVYSGVKFLDFENNVVGSPKIVNKAVPIITICYTDDSNSEDGDIVVVSASDGGVNLRSGPGTEYDVVESMIPVGDVLSIKDRSLSEDGKDWLRVEWKDSEGWVAESQVTDGSEYILPYSSIRELDNNDLEGLSAIDLTYARNEIYAKHGFSFGSEELQGYFNKKTWYKRNDSFDGKLYGIEEKNAGLISDYQKQNGLTYKPE